MSTYSVKGKGWRYDFTLNGTRYTNAWFETKNKAKQAEAKRKEEILNPRQEKEIPTAMGFLELVNRRLDHVRAYNSASHYRDHIYMARRWIKEWNELTCDAVSPDRWDPILYSQAITGFSLYRQQGIPVSQSIV